MQSLGHPLLGDPMYGRKKYTSRMEADIGDT